MTRILLLETSTALCSAALAEDGKVVSEREEGGRVHASRLAPMVKEVLDERGISVKDCDAVCVSMGPGSFTGLRVGVSTAKGLCFGAGIPLLAIGSLDTLVWQAREGGLTEGCKYVVPLIDARRLEVYTAVYPAEGEAISKVEPKVLDETSFEAQLSEGTALFIGDGAAKAGKIITSPNARFEVECPSAKSMAKPAALEFESKRWRDIAYFEPFYLKDFIPTIPKHKVL